MKGLAAELADIVGKYRVSGGCGVFGVLPTTVLNSSL